MIELKHWGVTKTFNAILQNTSSLLGVAGIDVPIKSLKNWTPFEAIGPNGYSFIINNNGFLILHPKLQKQLSYLSVSETRLITEAHFDYFEITLTER